MKEFLQIYYIFPPSKDNVKNSLKNRSIVLIAPDENLRNGSERLHQHFLVRLRHFLVLLQHPVQISGIHR